ncbi:CHAT domain-containing protein [Kallotenue papyrolyticum]|uniref:CHAT domain-containing protein n=1 Tax=Kallotenue papyrolyticum TaxID=1325125 RepID=UPI000478573B|nr:CHAT domain-containing protein [Kallotenue papyrolyticum]
MNADAILDRLLQNAAALDELGPLADAIADVVVQRLKQEADRHWAINPHRSLELADLIERIGATRGDVGQQALGVMARGDALKLLGHNQEAWAALEQAGAMFRTIGDDLGWARTRIGRLGLCVDLNRIAEALEDAAAARAIFAAYQDHDKLLRLDYNTAFVLCHLGDPQRALPLIQAALDTATRLGAAGEQYLSWLYTIQGFAYDGLGQLRAATDAYLRARAICEQRGEWNAAARVEHNLAYLAIAQGHYRAALRGLQRSYDLAAAEFPHIAAHARRDMLECYLALNRYAEARDLAQQVYEQWCALDAQYEAAVTLVLLATAEAELGHDEAARATLDRAEAIFAQLGASAWIMTVRLRRGRIALRQRDLATAEHEAATTAAWFAQAGQRVPQATAMLLLGQIAHARSDLTRAADCARAALRIAQQSHMPALRYAAHLLLGHIAAAQHQPGRAERRYRAAVATIERVQRGLTLTLRPSFLEDKHEPLHALITLYLRQGRLVRAFETLERTRALTLLGYLANREHLLWSADDPDSRLLIAELEQLRSEHHWFLRLLHETPGADDEVRPTITPDQARHELALRERRLRAITEQLYLRAGDDGFTRVEPIALSRIQAALDDDTLLIAFYTDRERIWAFSLDRTTLLVHPLAASVTDVNRLLSQFQTNVAATLREGPHTPLAGGLHMVAQRLLQRLYGMLLAGLGERLQGRRRLLGVPFGPLHYLPLHLLHNGSGYLIEQYEVVMLPSAALAARQGPARPPGARVLAHSWNNHLPQTLQEAGIVVRLFGGEILAEEAARRAALSAPPRQILHIAAHGQYRLDQPELSYIQLDDGQLYTDDLLQCDLSYELVTLSACETGRARIAGGDEPIGLGRGLLYAGAGALLLSLWRVADESTIRLMECFYRALHDGASKAAAIRAAQCALIAAQPHLHPAFWGAFQLIGDARPLQSMPPDA